jgi:hypothetical protein
MGKRNYEIFYKILELEVNRKVTGNESKYKSEWAAFLQENESNRHTVYDNRLDVQQILKRLEPYNKVTGKALIISAEIKELVKAMEGMNL